MPTLPHPSAYISDYKNIEVTVQGTACKFPPPRLNVHKVACVCLQLDFATMGEDESKAGTGL